MPPQLGHTIWGLISLANSASSMHGSGWCFWKWRTHLRIQLDTPLANIIKADILHLAIRILSSADVMELLSSSDGSSSNGCDVCCIACGYNIWKVFSAEIISEAFINAPPMNNWPTAG